MRLFTLVTQVEVQFYCYLTDLYMSMQSISVFFLSYINTTTNLAAFPRKVAWEGSQWHSIPQKKVKELSLKKTQISVVEV